jgi:hypothetical protein
MKSAAFWAWPAAVTTRRRSSRSLASQLPMQAAELS